MNSTSSPGWSWPRGIPASSSPVQRTSAATHSAAPAASSRQNAACRRERLPRPRRHSTTAAASGGATRSTSPAHGPGSTRQRPKYRTAKARARKTRRRVAPLGAGPVETGVTPSGELAGAGPGSAARPSCWSLCTPCTARRVAARSASSDSRGSLLRKDSSAQPPTAMSGLFSSCATPVAKWTYSDEPSVDGGIPAAVSSPPPVRRTRTTARAMRMPAAPRAIAARGSARWGWAPASRAAKSTDSGSMTIAAISHPRRGAASSSSRPGTQAGPRSAQAAAARVTMATIQSTLAAL